MGSLGLEEILRHLRQIFAEPLPAPVQNPVCLAIGQVRPGVGFVRVDTEQREAVCVLDHGRCRFRATSKEHGADSETQAPQCVAGIVAGSRARGARRHLQRLRLHSRGQASIGLFAALAVGAEQRSQHSFASQGALLSPRMRWVP